MVDLVEERPEAGRGKRIDVKLKGDAIDYLHISFRNIVEKIRIRYATWISIGLLEGAKGHTGN